MAKHWKVLCCTGVLSLAWALTPSVQAEGILSKCIPNVKIDAGVNAWFKIHTPNKAHLKQLAPWYSYFPYDPSVMGPQTGTIYPNWPQPFPPAPQDPKMSPANTGPNSGHAPPARPRPIAANFASQVQPAGFYSTSYMPGYWHAR